MRPRYERACAVVTAPRTVTYRFLYYGVLKAPGEHTRTVPYLTTFEKHAEGDAMLQVMGESTTCSSEVL